MQTNAIFGRLDAYAETGTEGVIWSLCEHDRTDPDGKYLSHDGLHVLKDGDLLVVFQDNAKDVLWSGVVQLEYQRRYRPYPMNPKYGQQEVFGFWVHGFQDGVDPEVWAKMFLKEKPAMVIKDFARSTDWTKKFVLPDM